MELRRIASTWVCSIAATLAALGCGDGATAPSGRADSSPFQLSVTSADLQPGESVQIHVTPGGEAAWTSSDPGVASVSRTGMVTAVREGNAQITATRAGRSARAQIAVTRRLLDGETVFEDGFESETLRGAQNGFVWSGPAFVETSTERARTGSRSLKFRFAGLGAKAVTEQSRAQLNFDFPRSNEVWIEWHAYYPTGEEGIAEVGKYEHGTSTPDNNKLLRVYADGHYSKAPEWGASTVGETYGGGGTARTRVDAFLAAGYAGGNVLPAGSLTNKPVLIDVTRDLGRWVHLRFHGRKSNGAANDGLVRIWKDGALVLEQKELDLYDPSGVHDYFDTGYLYGAANSGFPRPTAIYVDDFRLFRSDPGW